MFVDLKDLLSKKKISKELDLTIEEKSFNDSNEEIEFLSPIVFNGSINIIGDIINLTGTVKTKIQLICSRCLEPFPYDINLKINEKFSNIIANEDVDVIFLDSDTTEIIVNNIILTLPIKRLCKENCKGLCQQCGSNLNNSVCNCVKDDIDPRLAKLKDLFWQIKEVFTVGNPARRFSKGRRDSRRAQTFKLSLPGIVECPQCHEMKLAHRVCKNCGYYKGKEVVAVEK